MVNQATAYSKPPRRPVDPEVIFGRTQPRVVTPKQLGQLLAHALLEDRDRLLVLAGTGLCAGELCGLRRERVQLREHRLEVVTVRYDAGRFGRGYKHRPKSTAGIRVVPLAEAVAEVLARYLPGSRGSLLFPEATRYVLRHGYLRAVRHATKGGYLVGLDLRGPHDLRHTFATWLEDDGIPTRVIDELMGQAATRRPSWASDRGSPMGAIYGTRPATWRPGSSTHSMPACGGSSGHRCAQVTVCGRSARRSGRICQPDRDNNSAGQRNEVSVWSRGRALPSPYRARPVALPETSC